MRICNYNSKPLPIKHIANTATLVSQINTHVVYKQNNNKKNRYKDTSVYHILIDSTDI